MTARWEPAWRPRSYGGKVGRACNVGFARTPWDVLGQRAHPANPTAPFPPPRAPRVDDVLHLAHRLLGRVHAADVQQLAEGLVSGLHDGMGRGGTGGRVVAQRWDGAGAWHVRSAHSTRRPSPPPGVPCLVAPLVEGGHGQVVHKQGQFAARGRAVRASLALVDTALRRGFEGCDCTVWANG